MRKSAGPDRAPEHEQQDAPDDEHIGDVEHRTDLAAMSFEAHISAVELMRERSTR
ncbi:MAG: hypothetical protein ACRENE_15810 [Polyangiaceae bacterium]